MKFHKSPLNLLDNYGFKALDPGFSVQEPKKDNTFDSNCVFQKGAIEH